VEGVIRLHETEIENEEAGGESQNRSPCPEINRPGNRRNQVNENQGRRLNDVFEEDIDDGGQGQHHRHDQELPRFIFTLRADAFRPVPKHSGTLILICVMHNQCPSSYS